MRLFKNSHAEFFLPLLPDNSDIPSGPRLCFARIGTFERKIMMSRILCALTLALILSLPLPGQGRALAQIDSYSALLEAVSQAADDDILIISGVIAPTRADPPLRADASLIIRGAEDTPAELIGLQIDSMKVGFSNVRFSQGLDIQGDSQVQLMSGTRVEGASGASAISMHGSGVLHIDKGASVLGGSSDSGQIGRAHV